MIRKRFLFLIVVGVVGVKKINLPIAHAIKMVYKSGLESTSLFTGVEKKKWENLFEVEFRWYWFWKIKFIFYLTEIRDMSCVYYVSSNKWKHDVNEMVIFYYEFKSGGNCWGNCIIMITGDFKNFDLVRISTHNNYVDGCSALFFYQNWSIRTDSHIIAFKSSARFRLIRYTRKSKDIWQAPVDNEKMLFFNCNLILGGIQYYYTFM